MKTLFSRPFVGALALLCSSVATAATVTVVPSTLEPAVNDTFTITLTATDFVNIGGGTFSVTWDATKVTYQGSALPATGPVGPGTGTFLVDNAPTFDLLPGTPPVSGDFDLAVFTFLAIADGPMNLNVFENAVQFDGWFDNDTADQIPTDYVQASVVVGGGVVLEPAIDVTDSVAPADDQAVDFGLAQIGITATQTVTVTNNGTADLIIGAITSPAAPFSLNPDMCGGQTLAPTESCAITVDFFPEATQSYSGNLVIPSNDAANPTVTVTLAGTGTAAPVADITVTDSVAPTDDLDLGFGNVEIATTSDETITVTNDGTADLTISAVNLTGASFTKTSDLCAAQTLAATESCVITVQFAPAAEQAYAGTVDILSDDPDEPTVTVDLSGTGTPPVPIASVTDTVVPANDLLIAFGNVVIGGTSPAETVTVTNSGTVDLVVGDIAVANALDAPFFIGNDTCSGQTVAPAGSCTLEVQFMPTVLGAATDGFDIPSNAAGSPITFNVNGSGVPVPVPDITVTDSVAPANDLAVPFGTVALSDTQTRTITVTNDGSADLVVDDVVAPAAPFSITGTSCDGPTLEPTESCTITVQFTPDVAQVYNSSVGIESNDPDEPTVTVALSGTGSEGSIVIDGGSSAVDPWSLAFLGGLPFLRRRRKAAAMKLAAAAAAGILAAPSAIAADNWDWDYDGFYLGAGVIGTSLETSDEFSSALQDELGLAGIPARGNFEDFPYGGQIYAGWMFNNIFGLEGRWSDSGDGESDILLDTGASRTDIGDIEISLDGWTVYGVANWPIAKRWDLFAKAGYTDQDIDADISADGERLSASDDDSGFAGALGARWRFARHWAATVEGEYLGVDFDSVLDEPWRVGLNIEYWFGGAEIPAPMAAAAPPPPPKPAPAPPPPPPPADSDGDGVVDASDQCADTPKGDRVGAQGCSCDVTRQLTFRTDSAALSDADKEVLDEMAANLTNLKFISGVIEGHTDSTGAEDYNQGLSERRAQAAADYLVSKGISGDRLEVVGRGESDPVGDNATAEGRALNRRVVAKRTDCGM